MRKTAYSALARVYEDFLEKDLQEKWEAYLLGLISRYASGKTCADVACGSGILTRALKRNGYDVVGVDVSEEMLTVAQEKAGKEGLNIPFVLQDMQALSLLKKPDFITVVNDGLNYVRPDKLTATFKRFKKNLKKGGVLFFDFSTRYKLENVLGDNTFAEDGEDSSYIWFNEFLGDSVRMELSVFSKRKDGSYDKKEEAHLQYAYTAEEMLAILKESGFSAVAEGFLGEKPDERTERIQIIAKAE